ncbi:MAG: hypothetical protein AB8B91_09950 [Rubripirellula sp.]
MSYTEGRQKPSRGDMFDATPTPRAQPTANPLVLGSIAAALGLLAFLVALPQTRQQSAPIPQPVSSIPVEPARDVIRAAFFDSEVQPRMTETDAQNRQAAQRCVQRLRRVIRGYRDGIQPFVEDLTSLSTRFGIVRRMPGNWWKGDKRVDVFVQQKFEKHFFSQQSLTSDFAAVLNEFRSEVEANQRRMLIDIRASLDTADLPEVDLEEYETFLRSVAAELTSEPLTQGANSVYAGLTTLLVSEAGTYATVAIVAALLTRIGSTAAATAAVGVGATAGAAATGAGGGSLVGPVGTVVGLGVGLAVGLVIDWWMTDQFKDKMDLQMNAYLDSLESTLLEGPAISMVNHPNANGPIVSSAGIVGTLPLVCDRLLVAYRERFFQQIVTVNEP